PQALRARRIRVLNRAVVVAVGGRIAPPVAGRQAPHRQRRGRTADPIRAVQHAHEAPGAERGRPVALALARLAPSAAQGTREGQAAELNDAALGGGRKAHDRGLRRATPAGQRTQVSGHAWRSRPALCFLHRSNARLAAFLETKSYLEPERYEHRTEDSHRR